MKMAFLLLTCGREKHTQKTLDSFSRFVDPSRFVLLHGDDCSETTENKKLAYRVGFETVLETKNRMGVAYMWQSLVKIAALRGVDWIVFQENDWEWVRDFPFEAMEYAHSQEDIYYVRFFGKYREANNQRPCNPMHMVKKTHPVWEKIGNEWQKGDIHWGFPANATKTKEAVFLTSGINAEGDARKRSAEIKKLTMRPVENYVYHIGENRTDGFIA